MSDTVADILRRHTREMEPIATGVEPVLRKLPNVRAVLFDVYGTLFISGSGEVGTAVRAACEQALSEAFDALGIATVAEPGQGVEYLFRAIEASHAESRRLGIDYPEVDIVEIWRDVVAELGRQGVVERSALDSIDFERLAVQYEARANPCWPMPAMQKCLTQLRHAGIVLGIISNAQFYTAQLFVALLGEPAESWGFDPKMQYYSYRYGRSKPGLGMHRAAVEALSSRGITPDETLYVGNDMLNDVWPACKLGFRTALFAGDGRSLRCREEDQRLASIVPDLVLTDLGQLPGCIIS